MIGVPALPAEGGSPAAMTKRPTIDRQPDPIGAGAARFQP